MFLGREEELRFLEEEYSKKRSSFIVVYGRRRVGKTTLIKEFIKNKKSLYFLASEEIENENKKGLMEKASIMTGQEYLKNAKFDKWDDIFDIIVKYNKEEKKVIVIDEFQYLVNSNRAYSSILQRIWDEKLKDENVMLIICGSYISMMIRETLSYGSPLYGRRTGQINLKPLKFRDTMSFYTSNSNEDLINFYSVTGGVPKYIELIKDDSDLYESITKNILRKDSFLYDEPIFLMDKEVNEVSNYFSILKVIANGNRKIGDISGVLEMQSSRLSPYLKTLTDLEILEKRIPVTEKQPEKSRKGLYFIKDNFINFWFRFIFNNKGELEIGNIEYVLQKIKNNLTDNHTSFVYEDVAREILWEENTKNKLPFRFSKLGSYWGGSVEIDIVAYDKDNILIGECKYTKKEIDVDLFFDLQKKVNKTVELNEYENKYFVFFSKSGFTKKMKKLSEERKDIFLYKGIERV
ncbi:MAG TPA: ATPase [Clostridiales bacterium]|nr:MAG: ATPase [Clostridiales bacterium GWD2_32_59]HAN09188.1 ATPase [Clostridiales bacterium]